MKFLIDGHRDRVAFRAEQWPEAVCGQLLTPLTRYRRGHQVFAIDNGSFSSFNEKKFVSLLKREYPYRETCLFVAVPDFVGCHKTTLKLYEDHKHLANGFKLAFVAQDGYTGMPDCADALFIGGTNLFKDSQDAYDAVTDALYKEKHVHIGRVNSFPRYKKYFELGAHTCDGSGISRYGHMIETLRDLFNAQNS